MNRNIHVFIIIGSLYYIIIIKSQYESIEILNNMFNFDKQNRILNIEALIQFKIQLSSENYEAMQISDEVYLHYF